MPITKINIKDFVLKLDKTFLFDVRSPSEYNHAHIPGAKLLPIFSDDERRIVGTLYKQESREKAIKIGLEFFGKKTVQLLENADSILLQNTIETKEITIYCWRGGMRSSAMAWLFDLYGYKVNLIIGGYKSYRIWALQQFENEYQLNIISGYTGSNKTGILHELKKQNEPVIDLEKLAEHKGSAFGNLDLVPQPSQEYFENILALELFKLNLSHPKKSIWIEDESQRIGQVNIPTSFFKLMRGSPILFITVPFELRLNHIIEGYGKFEKEKLINAIIRIKKKLGGFETKQAINFLLEDDVKSCFSELLKYYDKQYIKGRAKRDNIKNGITQLFYKTTQAQLNATDLINYVRK
jgi:tRNA 2-selenouridine synthase